MLDTISIICGIAFAGIFTILGNSINGYWQNRNMKEERIGRGIIERQFANHEYRIKTIGNKISSLYLGRWLLSTKQQNANFISDIERKISEKNLKESDFQNFAMALYSNKILVESHPTWSSIFNWVSSSSCSDPEKYDCLVSLQNIIQEKTITEYNDELSKLDYSGWMLFIHNQATIEEIDNLWSYMESLEHYGNIPLLEIFEKETTEQLKKISELARKEIIEESL